MLLGRLLEHLISVGTLRVTDAGGRVHRFGRGGEPFSSIRLHDRKTERALFWNPRIAVGEAYMEGSLTPEEGTAIYDFIDIAALNMEVAPPSPFTPLYL